MQIVDPSNPIPKYLQISTWLRELIRTGRYKKGEKLPSEIELSKICEVNRNTLRQAILELTTRGILRKEKGMGTFVVASEPVTVKHKLKRITSFGEDLNEIGFQEKTKLLKMGTEAAGEYVSKNLMLGKDATVIAVQRLRIGDGVPLIYEESFLPGEMFEGLLDMDLTGSMYQLFSGQFNIVLTKCDQNIRAINLTQRISGLLDVPENSAGLYMESITYNEHNIPIEVLCSYYRGDKYIFEIELGKYHVQADNAAAFNGN